MAARDTIARALHRSWRQNSRTVAWEEDDANIRAAFLGEADAVIEAVRGMPVEDQAELANTTGRVRFRWNGGDGCTSVWDDPDDARRDSIEQLHPDAVIERQVTFQTAWEDVR